METSVASASYLVDPEEVRQAQTKFFDSLVLKKTNLRPNEQEYNNSFSFLFIKTVCINSDDVDALSNRVPEMVRNPYKQVKHS